MMMECYRNTIFLKVSVANIVKHTDRAIKLSFTRLMEQLKQETSRYQMELLFSILMFVSTFQTQKA